MLMRRKVLGVLFLVVSAGVQADSISIRADEWLPYNGPLNKKPPGYMIEMAELIAKKNGHTIDYRTMPWDDAVAAARKGDVDCVVGALKSDAEGFMFPQEPWGSNVNGFFALEELNWRYEGIESLSQIRLAVIEEYSYGDEIDAYVKANAADPNKVIVVSSTGRALVNAVARLVSNKADVIIEDTNVAQNIFRKMQMTDRMKEVGLAGEAESLYVACTPANPRGKQFADLFSKGTVELRQSGELASILENYGLTDWAQ